MYIRKYTMKKINQTWQLCFILLLSILLNSCSKNNGENQGLDDSNSSAYDFMSTKEGSWWKYKADDGSIFYRFATGKDSLVPSVGLTLAYYYRIDSTSVMKEKIPEYFGKNQDKYLSLIDLDGSEVDYIKFIILKEHVKDGDEWVNTEDKKISGFNLNLKIESKVESSNGTLNLDGKTYHDVIHVYSDLKVKSVLMPAFVNCGKLEVWFKKGVGILKESGDINVIELVKKNYGDYLVDYHIEP
jgi:hypothetical protein